MPGQHFSEEEVDTILSRALAIQAERQLVARTSGEQVTIASLRDLADESGLDPDRAEELAEAVDRLRVGGSVGVLTAQEASQVLQTLKEAEQSRATSISADQLKAIAAEAGIGAGDLEEAIRDIESGWHTAAEPARRVKTADGVAFERSVPFVLDDADWMDLVQAARDVTGQIGRFDWIPSGTERIWISSTMSGDLNPVRVLQARRRGQSTVLRAEVKSSRASVSLSIVCGIVLFLAIVSGAQGVSPGAIGFGILALATWTVGQLYLRGAQRRLARILNEVLDRAVQRNNLTRPRT